MLPTFVVGLREGLEASLIVGIIATFLVAQGARGALKKMWLGVGLAMVLCLGVGLALKFAEEELPTKQQEGLETIVALLAVAMVTYMIVWMRSNARGLKGEIEGNVSTALASGSAAALIGMAFMAVLREGFETSVFLVALFQSSRNTGAGVVGAVLGLAVAIIIGYGIYKGGVRINMARFFRITGVVLVFVVAGLFVSATHTAHEAGWLNAGQHQVADWSSFLSTDSVQYALVTGMLGIQPRPVVAEVIAWLVVFIPLLAFVLWPAKPPTRSTTSSVSSSRPTSVAGAASA